MKLKLPALARRLKINWADQAWTPRVVIGPAAHHSEFWFRSVNSGQTSQKIQPYD